MNIANLYDFVASCFGVDKGSERFERKFINAFNMVSDDLRAYTDDGLDHDEITSTSVNADIAQKYNNVYTVGTRHYLQFSKEWGIEPDPQSLSNYRSSLGAAQALYLKDNPPLTRSDEEE